MLLPERFFDVADAEIQGIENKQNFVDRTYDLNNPGRFIDGIEATKQAVCKILKTERFRYRIYSEDYGIETIALFGTDSEYALAEIERRITEALCADKRIIGISGFSAVIRRGEVHAAFTVNTVHGGEFEFNEIL
jgi:hypothetical protein